MRGTLTSLALATFLLLPFLPAASAAPVGGVPTIASSGRIEAEDFDWSSCVSADARTDSVLPIPDYAYGDAQTLPCTFYYSTYFPSEGTITAFSSRCVPGACLTGELLSIEFSWRDSPIPLQGGTNHLIGTGTFGRSAGWVVEAISGGATVPAGYHTLRVVVTIAAGAPTTFGLDSFDTTFKGTVSGANFHDACVAAEKDMSDEPAVGPMFTTQCEFVESEAQYFQDLAVEQVLLAETTAKEACASYVPPPHNGGCAFLPPPPP